MFYATNFTYDGISSAAYGLKIATFDSSDVEVTDCFDATIKTIKSSKSNRFFAASVTYDTPPTFQFDIISEDEISDQIRREVLSWLIARKDFKTLIIEQEDLLRYCYKCIFNNASIIYVNGRCHGFRVTATFNSPYAYYNDYITKTITSQGSEEEVEITIPMDLPDEYLYPVVEFNFVSAVDGKDISIINTTDDQVREFSFAGLAGNNTDYSVDNERKIITGVGENLLEKFSSESSKKWLRLRPGVNNLKVKINGTATIKFVPYVKIGF